MGHGSAEVVNLGQCRPLGGRACYQRRGLGKAQGNRRAVQNRFRRRFYDGFSDEMTTLLEPSISRTLLAAPKCALIQTAGVEKWRW